MFASALIADGWDPQAVADRLGDRLETVLRVYAHAFESRRAAAAQRDALEARYGDGMATDKRQQAATDAMSAGAEPVDLRAIRDGRR